jgi:murein DD-endopeptidase MepM/ murein hydrolase activator NlpD
VIGLVGATGLAEAPHLHYEFVVNGVHRNPRTVKLPQAQPIASAEKTRFQQATAPLLAELVKHQQNIQLAAAKSASSSAN